MLQHSNFNRTKIRFYRRISAFILLWDHDRGFEEEITSNYYFVAKQITIADIKFPIPDNVMPVA